MTSAYFLYINKRNFKTQGALQLFFIKTNKLAGESCTVRHTVKCTTAIRNVKETNANHLTYIRLLYEYPWYKRRPQNAYLNHEIENNVIKLNIQPTQKP